MQGLLHFFMPKITLFGFCVVGSLALHKTFFKFGGCLKATIGGVGKIFNIFGSKVIVFQCFFRIPDTLGSFGLNVNEHVTLSVGFFWTFFRA